MYDAIFGTALNAFINIANLCLLVFGLFQLFKAFKHVRRNKEELDTFQKSIPQSTHLPIF